MGPRRRRRQRQTYSTASARISFLDRLKEIVEKLNREIVEYLNSEGIDPMKTGPLVDIS